VAPDGPKYPGGEAGHCTRALRPGR
jgi:hypothetical protein